MRYRMCAVALLGLGIMLASSVEAEIAPGGGASVLLVRPPSQSQKITVGVDDVVDLTKDWSVQWTSSNAGDWGDLSLEVVDEKGNATQTLSLGQVWMNNQVQKVWLSEGPLSSKQNATLVVPNGTKGRVVLSSNGATCRSIVVTFKKEEHTEVPPDYWLLDQVMAPAGDAISSVVSTFRSIASWAEGDRTGFIK